MPYLSSNPPIADIRIVSVQGSYRHIWHNACFLLMLNGEIQVQVNDHASYLNGNDVMLVEADTPYTVTGHGSNLVMTIRMDYDFFAQGKAGQGLGSLVCNSAEDGERDYSLLKKMLAHLALNYFETAENRELRQLELCYALLYHLNTTYYVADSPELAGTSAIAKRDRQLLSYIESNYMHELQLEDLAQISYLSISYLSRRFRKLSGTNFKAHLQDIRLRHAVAEMRSTSQTITAIAYNNGFPNVNALNAAIRKKYNMPPSEFRKALTEKELEEADLEPYEVVKYDDVRANLQVLAGVEPYKAMGIYRYPDQIEYRIDQVARTRPIQAIWKTMINIGILKMLTDANIKSQLSMVQEEIGFKYARIEGVLTNESIPMLPSGQYNFSRFDRAIELLLSLKLTPFLDLSFKDDYIMLSRSNVVYRADKPKSRSSEKEFVHKVSALIRHCINTFGSEEVKKWGLEICVHHNETLQFLETPADYVRRFCKAYGMIKEWLPEILVGGPEHNTAMDMSFLEEISRLFVQRKIKPDFYSLCAVPSSLTILENGEQCNVTSPNPEYLRDSVRNIKDCIFQIFGEHIPIWITVLFFDIRTRNYMNDSCYQATFIAKNTIDLLDLVDVIGYWQLSDIDTEYIDTTRILFGGTGILSKDGLKKPGFTTLKRLAGINTQLVEKTGNLLMTTNAINTYNIVLYNYAHFNELYCLSNGEGITCGNVYTVFDSAATKDICIHLGGLQTGRYKVITTTLNREHGSLFDEWLRYGVLDGLQPHDIRYLRDIVHPHRAVRYQVCEDGSMELTVQMLPHEVKFIILIREL